MKPVVKLCCVVCLVMLAHAGLYGQTTYHVSLRGNDRNPGTRRRPFKSIDKLNQLSFKPGDRILFEANAVYPGELVLGTDDASSPQKPIEIGSYGKGKATLKATSGNGITVANLNGLVIRDVVVTSAGLEGNDGYGVKLVNDRPGNSRRDLVRITNVEASGFRWAGIFVGGIATDLPNVKAPPGSRFGFSNVQITHCLAHDNMYYGIYVSAAWTPASTDYGNEDVLIRDCIVHDNGGDPTYTANHSGSGILVDDTKKVLIEYCTYYRNGARNAGLTGGPCGIWSHASTNVLIQYCEAYSNKTNGAADGGGFDFDGGVTHSVIQYCYSHDNDGPGYLMWNYESAPHQLSDNTIRYSISANDARKHSYGAIHLGTSGSPITNMRVYHNTIYLPHTTEGNAKGIWTGGSAANENLHFYNNLIITDGKAPLLDIDPGQKNIFFGGNAYWCTNKEFLLNYDKQPIRSLSQWQTDKHQETLQGKSYGLFADPEVTADSVQQTIGDPHHFSKLKTFRLLPASPLLRNGIRLRTLNLEPVTKDFWGNAVPADREPDIGAYQFGH